jgi:YHS domain-containing protein
MKKLSHWITVSSAVAAALSCLALHSTGFAQSYTIRPAPPCPDSQCKVKTETFGYNDTNWREWPVQPRPEEKDSKTIGGHKIPTPPPIPEPKLPHWEPLPARPSISGGTTGTILPSGSGSTAIPGLGGGTATLPGTALPAPNAPVVVPPGDFSLPGLDLNPVTPKPGSSIQPLPKDSLLPGGNPLPPLTPSPVTPGVEPANTPDKDAPAPKSSIQVPDLAPLPASKPQAPALPEVKPQVPPPDSPAKGGSLSRPGKDPVAAGATTIPNDLPVQADWDASLGPDAAAENQLRHTSYDQRTAETGNPLRRAMDGYCPVQLQENNRWVPGKADFQAAYQGQVFHCSSETARKRFEAAPEKYAPVHRGNDVVLAVEENRTVPGSVNHSVVWHGRLYLFSSSASLATFREDPARYAADAGKTPLQIPADSL